MSWLTSLPVVFALEGEWDDVRAVLVVAVSVVVLIGSLYMLLASNYGARLGYLVLMVSLGIWMILFSLIWLVGVPGTVPGLGPRAEEPHWVPFKPDSEQAQEFRQAIDDFPTDWDEPGEKYPGQIDSSGEFDTVKTVIQDALARDAQENDLAADLAEDWDFRLRGTEVPADEENPPPVASARFLQVDADTLLFGVTIPATDDHREVTVFALRDKGQVFLYALYFLIASIIGFALHAWLLVRYERTHEPAEGAEPVPTTV
ncbi:MAG TPA: hypothetical protein VGB52_02790 [Actinomycetota bacterium]